MNKFVFYLVTLLNFLACKADIFTSLGEMVKLVDTNNNIIGDLEQYINLQIKNIQTAKTLLNEFKTIANNSRDNPDIFIGNPVNSFLLIKLLSKDLEKVVDSLGSFDKLTGLLENIKSKYNLPTEEDYRGSIIALHRLEDTCNQRIDSYFR